MKHTIEELPFRQPMSVRWRSDSIVPVMDYCDSRHRWGGEHSKNVTLRSHRRGTYGGNGKAAKSRLRWN
jgi:hypothetical protein